MSFDGTEGGEITLALGAEYTDNYRTNNPNTRIAHFFGKDILEEILEQDGCVGIRMYYGEQSDGTKELVIVGADSSENDLTDLVADLSSPCQNRCSKPNALNS